MSGRESHLTGRPPRRDTAPLSVAFCPSIFLFIFFCVVFVGCGVDVYSSRSTGVLHHNRRRGATRRHYRGRRRKRGNKLIKKTVNCTACSIVPHNSVLHRIRRENRRHTGRRGRRSGKHDKLPRVHTRLLRVRKITCTALGSRSFQNAKKMPKTGRLPA